MPEIHQAAPHAVYMQREGEVNAWDNDDFVQTVRATGRKTLIMAGVWTGVCVMFPALDAKAAGFTVYAVIDASGDPSELVSRTTLARFAQAGIIPTSANAVLSECTARGTVLNGRAGEAVFPRDAALRGGHRGYRKAQESLVSPSHE